MSKGRLFLLPVPLGDSPPADVLPPPVLTQLRELRHFVAENAKSARAFLKAASHPISLRELAIAELDEHTAETALPHLLSPLIAGEDLGLLSEAGCPAVADPGSGLVALAHEAGIRVVPMIGPSSLLLALMASGLNGQHFTFNGYLPTKEAARTFRLRELERESRQTGGVQIFIETPYRNSAMFNSVLTICAATTRFCVAADLTLTTEYVRTARISEWRKTTPPLLERRPTVFLLQG